MRKCGVVLVFDNQMDLEIYFGGSYQVIMQINLKRIIDCVWKFTWGHDEMNIEMQFEAVIFDDGRCHWRQ